MVASSRLLNGSYQADHSPVALFLTPIAVIASLVAVLTLATMRFVFRQWGTKEDDERDGLTAWQALVKELAGVLREYVAKKGSGANRKIEFADQLYIVGCQPGHR